MQERFTTLFVKEVNIISKTFTTTLANKKFFLMQPIYVNLDNIGIINQKILTEYEGKKTLLPLTWPVRFS